MPTPERERKQQEYTEVLEDVLHDVVNASLESPTAVDYTCDLMKRRILQAARDTLPLRTPYRPEAKYMTEELRRLQQQLQQCTSHRETTITIDGRVYNRTTHKNYLRNHLRQGLRRAQHQYLVRQCTRAAEAFRRHDLGGSTRLSVK